MKFSFIAPTNYPGPTPGFEVWPTPPRYCDRQIAQQTLTEAIDLYRHAEALGFDWVTVVEHHYSPLTLTPSPIVVGSALSQIIKRAKIAVLGPVVPLQNPVRIAEEIALLDQLTGGRVVVMLLRGTPQEQKTYGTHADTRGMTQEGIELILKAWKEPAPFAWNGKHYNFPFVSAWPRTLQDPHPQVFGSGGNEESVQFAARNRLSIAMSFQPVPTVKKLVQFYLDEADRAGWQPSRENVLFRGFTYIAETDTIAKERLAEANARKKAETEKALSEFRGNPTAYTPEPNHVILNPYFQGGPDTLLAKIRELYEAGVGIIDASFGAWLFSQADRMDAMNIYARHILPKAQPWP